MASKSMVQATHEYLYQHPTDCVAVWFELTLTWKGVDRSLYFPTGGYLVLECAARHHSDSYSTDLRTEAKPMP